MAKLYTCPKCGRETAMSYCPVCPKEPASPAFPEEEPETPLQAPQAKRRGPRPDGGKLPHGGLRAGAGRPVRPPEEKHLRLEVSLPPAEMALIDQMASALGMSRSALVCEAARALAKAKGMLK
jgi:hypothetical protein